MTLRAQTNEQKLEKLRIILYSIKAGETLAFNSSDGRVVRASDFGAVD